MYGPYAQPRGPLAARLRQRKAELLRRFRIPDDLLPGSLSQSHLRCGKLTCHCRTFSARLRLSILEGKVKSFKPNAV